MPVSANEVSWILRFGVFELDVRAGELRRNGLKVKIQDQPLQILAMLLERPGQIVTRDELRARLWSADTFVEFDNSFNSAIRRLREALGDSAENPRFVETLGRRGYRFMATVERRPILNGNELVLPQKRGKASSWPIRVAVASLSAVMLAGLIWALFRYPWRSTEVIERKLTANSLENSVTSAAVSPDGKYLVYADATGIYMKVVRTGETHPVPLPPNFYARVDDWFPDSSNILLSRIEEPGKAGLWSVSVFGGSPHKLADNASGGSLSPDGAHIAFRRGGLTYDGLWGREEWVMRDDGTDQVKVAASKSDGSQVGMPTWSPDGKRIAYIRSNWAWNARTSSVDINEWETGSSETLFSDSRLSPALHWLPDGRLIYAFGSAQQQQDSGLWCVSLQQFRKISSPAKRILAGHGWISQVSGSANGKVVIFLRGNWLPSVYVGTLSADHTHLLAHRRLTLDENENIPSAWTTDSQTVLFTSDRNGTREIFKQDIDQPVAQRVVSNAEQLSQPRVTPDGSEILYISTPRPGDPERLSSIFAIPMGGGIPRLVLKDSRIWNVQCARLPSTICLYSVTKGNTSETFRFDVKNGKSTEPPQIDPDCNWDLSPDGSERAIVVFGANDGKIHFRSTSTGKEREVVVKRWNGLMSAGWSADGKILLVSWHNFERESALLNVTLDGKASVLLNSSNPEVWAAIPSPDGHLLAIAEAGGPKNVWQIENF